jgi:long-subunit acyl-CoA synthetase (AMP-forming)
VGNGRGYLAAIVCGPVTEEAVQAGLDTLNLELPHYKQVRAFHLRPEAFSIESGLLTANGKLKRDAIALSLKNKIADLYESRAEVAS